jgi:hypothetical protein
MAIVNCDNSIFFKGAATTSVNVELTSSTMVSTAGTTFVTRMDGNHAVFDCQVSGPALPCDDEVDSTEGVCDTNSDQEGCCCLCILYVQ